MISNACTCKQISRKDAADTYVVERRLLVVAEAQLRQEVAAPPLGVVEAAGPVHSCLREGHRGHLAVAAAHSHLDSRRDSRRRSQHCKRRHPDHRGALLADPIAASSLVAPSRARS